MSNTGAEPAAGEWRVAQTPFDEALHDVVQTVAGPHAVGASGTLVADTGDGWEVVLDDGPTASNNVLTAADVTDDGTRIWFLGGGGVLGCYDVETGRKHDYSFPKEMTTSWRAVAVSGPAGSEKALAANASGDVLPFVVDGFDVDWAPVTKPGGSGATVAALAASPNGVGYAVDHSGNAYGTKDEGWEDIGIVNAQVALADITAGAGGRVYVAGGDGHLYRYDDSYRSWTPISVASAALRAVGVDGARLVAVGANGALYRRDGDSRWREATAPTDAALHDVALGGTDVAVGDHGVVLERPGRTRRGGSGGYSPSQSRGDTKTSNGAKKSGGATQSGGSKSVGGEQADGAKGSGTSDGATQSGSATQSGGTRQSGSAKRSGGTTESGDTTQSGSTTTSGDTTQSGSAAKSGSATQSGGAEQAGDAKTPDEPTADTGQAGGSDRRRAPGRAPERERLDRVRADARFIVAVADAERLAAGVDGLVAATDACGTDYLVVLD